MTIYVTPFVTHYVTPFVTLYVTPLMTLYATPFVTHSVVVPVTTFNSICDTFRHTFYDTLKCDTSCDTFL